MGLRDMLSKLKGTFSRKPVGSATAPCPGARPVIHIVDDLGRPTTKSARVESRVEVSNLVSRLDLPPGFLDPSNDRDNFKIEVIDSTLTGSNTIPAAQVELEALRPDRTSFSPPRKIQVELQRITGTNIFRSRYIRAVVDSVDQAACPPNQSILTDWDATQPNLNILGQIVRARYRSPTCGNVEWEATVGNDKRMFIRLAVHIVRATPGGAPVVTVANATRRINQWFRRIYAQVSLAPLLLQVRVVDPLENLVCIANNTGARATGGAVISFTIRAGAKRQTVSVTTRARDKAINTANHLAAEIRKQPLFNVRVVENPATRLERYKSADIIITDPAGARVVIENELSGDAAQTITVGRVNPAAFEEWENNPNVDDQIVASIQMRCLLQQYDTGQDRVELFVIGAFVTPTLLGAAVCTGEVFGVGRDKRALREVVMSAFVHKDCMDTGDDWFNVNAHEAGHVLLELFHADTTKPQMMWPEAPQTNVIDWGKRISEDDIPFVKLDGSYQNHKQGRRMRDKGRRVLAPFR